MELYTSFSNLLFKTMGSRHSPDKLTAAMNVKTVMHVSEMLLCLVLLSWYSPTLTVAVHVTGGCLLDFSRLLTRPLSVFLICNAIIVAVAVLSGDDSSNNAAPELQTPSPAAAADTVIADEVTPSSVGELSNKLVAGEEEEQRSMILATAEVGDGNQVLQCPPARGAGEEEVRRNPVEDLSTEEFNLTVEKYIARTKSFLHKERLDDICKFETRDINRS